jgi:hypothetical protein
VQCHLRRLGMGLRSLKALRVFVGTFIRSFLAWQMALLISGRGAWQGHSSIKERRGRGCSKSLGVMMSIWISHLAFKPSLHELRG